MINGTCASPQKSRLERLDQKSEENRLPQKWPFSGDSHPKGNIFSHFWPFFLPFLAIFSKKTFSRGFRYFGMILLYFWVWFCTVFPLKLPSSHMWGFISKPIGEPGKKPIICCFLICSISDRRTAALGRSGSGYKAKVTNFGPFPCFIGQEGGGGETEGWR